MSNRIYDIHVERNTVMPKPIIIPNDYIFIRLEEPNVEIPSRRSQSIIRPALSNDYVYLYESDFNVGQCNEMIKHF